MLDRRKGDDLPAELDPLCHIGHRGAVVRQVSRADRIGECGTGHEVHVVAHHTVYLGRRDSGIGERGLAARAVTLVPEFLVYADSPTPPTIEHASRFQPSATGQQLFGVFAEERRTNRTTESAGEPVRRTGERRRAAVRHFHREEELACREVLVAQHLLGGT